MTRIAALFLLALGLFSGAALLAQPLGLSPTFSLLGAVLHAMSASQSQSVVLARVVAGALLLLAGVAALAIVAGAAGLFAPTGSGLALWYVLGVAGLFGLAMGLPLSRPAA